jgi:hypothetical protein
MVTAQADRATQNQGDAPILNSQRDTTQRITLQQVRAMRAVKKPSVFDGFARAASSIWTSVISSVGLVFSTLQKKKSFCELNGHALLMINGTVTNRCRYCDTEISSIDMLTTR